MYSYKRQLILFIGTTQLTYTAHKYHVFQNFTSPPDTLSHLCGGISSPTASNHNNCTIGDSKDPTQTRANN